MRKVQEYVPAVLVVSVGVVAPVDQVYELAPEAVSVVLLPEQMEVRPLIVPTGSGLTVRVTLSVAVQPLASVTVTV